jgi:hypothetical protein
MTNYMQRDAETGRFEPTEREQIVSEYITEEAGYWRGVLIRLLIP